ncbi:MAG: hypothetical protein ACK4MF_07995 [Hyphomicrobiaceae bacterium]
MTEEAFDAWADHAKSWHLTVMRLSLLTSIATITLAIGLLSPRLAYEAPLLWFGEHVEGTIDDVSYEPTGARKGVERFRMRINYTFQAADRRYYAGETQRDGIVYDQELTTGDAVGVYYFRNDPLWSVAEHRLRLDVYALLLFVPWLAFFGIALPVFYLGRLTHWRRRRAQHLPAQN